MFKFFAFTSFFVFFMACGDEPTDPSQLFDITLGNGQAQFQQNDTIPINIVNKKNKSIESVTYSIDGTALEVNNNTTVIRVATLGLKTIKANVNYDGKSVSITKKLKVLSNKAPALYTYKIINEFPHDNRAYTQGLEFHNDTLYESTGKRGRSSLRKVNYKTGEVLQQIDLDDTVFGEGMTILNGKIYQLTWQSSIGYIYDLEEFKKTDSFQYGESKEGWGLANDGEKLFKSDGSQNIWFLNPESLVEEGHMQIVTNKSIFNKANELEYVNGKLYANVYLKPSVMIINAFDGAIEGVVNFKGLSDKVTKNADWNDNDNVLNGIAYHPDRGTFFITGKDWDKLFEVAIMKK